MPQRNEGDQIWFRRSPGPPKIPYLPLVRALGKRPLIGTCLSPDLIGCNLHYLRNRSFPCVDPSTCEGCLAHRAPRKTFFIAAILGKEGEKAIVQMTDSVEAKWDEAYCMYRTLRGVTFELSRRDQKYNGLLFLRFSQRKLPLDELPKNPDVCEMLWRIWDMPPALLAISDLVKTPLERSAKREAHG